MILLILLIFAIFMEGYYWAIIRKNIDFDIMLIVVMSAL